MSNELGKAALLNALSVVVFTKSPEFLEQLDVSDEDIRLLLDGAGITEKALKAYLRTFARIIREHTQQDFEVEESIALVEGAGENIH